MKKGFANTTVGRYPTVDKKASAKPAQAKRKNKPGAGRPKEGRKRVVVYLLPDCIEQIDDLLLDEKDTPGKVIERWMEIGLRTRIGGPQSS